jgi:hypothetical protein
LGELQFEQRRRNVKSDSGEKGIDYQKANAFLEQELAINQNPDDVLPLELTKRHNNKRISKASYLSALKDSLEDRFLAFQIAELEKELAEVEKLMNQ